jgi:Transmembrane secretion effector
VPQLLISADHRDGLVLVRATYTVAADRGSSSCRPWPGCAGRGCAPEPPTGPSTKTGANPRVFIELFGVPSWEEHLRQHRERQTGTDLEYHDAAAALSDPPPQTDHYLAAAVQQ